MRTLSAGLADAIARVKTPGPQERSSQGPLFASMWRAFLWMKNSPAKPPVAPPAPRPAISRTKVGRQKRSYTRAMSSLSIRRCSGVLAIGWCDDGRRSR